MSIFDGIATIINCKLFAEGSPDYTRMAALHELNRSGLTRLDAPGLILSLYKHTVSQWQGANAKSPRQPSPANWRFTLETNISAGNTSREKQVEKGIARLAAAGWLDRDAWANQVPVASGLLNQYVDRKACVDLVHRTSPGCYDLIEMKMTPGSGHALAAAMQALMYGVLYLLSRRHAGCLGYESRERPLLAAERVRLVVLAPGCYYTMSPKLLLQQLSDALNAGLAAECAREGPSALIMEFAFESFPAEFQWPCGDDEILSAVQRRHAVFKPLARNEF